MSVTFLQRTFNVRISILFETESLVHLWVGVPWQQRPCSSLPMFGSGAYMTSTRFYFNIVLTINSYNTDSISEWESRPTIISCIGTFHPHFRRQDGLSWVFWEST